MEAYGMLLNLVKDYFVDMGYNPQYIEHYFSCNMFSEIAAIRLANANVVIRNKTDRTSHQTHIAVTGEMIDFFYPPSVFAALDTETIEYRDVLIARDNIRSLKNCDLFINDVYSIPLVEGKVTVGKRTQKQLQLSKKSSLNSPCFNELRLGLFENDLLIMLKYRQNQRILAIGLPQVFYLDSIPNYADKFETNTYLRIPLYNQK